MEREKLRRDGNVVPLQYAGMALAPCLSGVVEHGGNIAAKEDLGMRITSETGQSTPANLCGLRQIQPLASRTEGVQTPNILGLVMPEDEIVPILRADPKIARARRIPPVFYFHDFKGVPA
jgi:hypothetical protein